MNCYCSKVWYLERKFSVVNWISSLYSAIITLLLLLLLLLLSCFFLGMLVDEHANVIILIFVHGGGVWSAIGQRDCY